MMKLRRALKSMDLAIHICSLSQAHIRTRIRTSVLLNSEEPARTLVLFVNRKKEKSNQTFVFIYGFSIEDSINVVIVVVSQVDIIEENVKRLKIANHMCKQIGEKGVLVQRRRNSLSILFKNKDLFDERKRKKIRCNVNI